MGSGSGNRPDLHFFSERVNPAPGLNADPVQSLIASQVIQVLPHGMQRSRANALLLSLDENGESSPEQMGKELESRAWRVTTLRARNSSIFATPNDRIGRAPDHNSAEWALWIGRPMLGQWVGDVMTAVNLQITLPGNERNEATLFARGSAGIVALCAAAVDPRINHVVLIGAPASYVTEMPYEKQRLGIMAPGIVRDVGDIAQLAALIAPRRVIVAGAVSAVGKPLTHAEAEAQFASTRAVYRQLGAESQFRVTTLTNAADIALQFFE